MDRNRSPTGAALWLAVVVVVPWSAGPAAAAQSTATVEDGREGPHDFFTSLQSEDGRWAASIPRAAPDLIAELATGLPRHDLATTVAMTWSLLSDGNTTTRGPLKDSVARAVDWIAAETTGRAGHSALGAAEPLAAAFLADLAEFEDCRTASVAALHLQARLLSLQHTDGGWRVEGRAADDPTCLEATGWATWTLGRLARGGQHAAATLAHERAREFLRSRSGDRTAHVFALYFDSADAGADPTGVADAARRLSELGSQPGWLASAPQLEFVLSAAAFQLGGEPWKRWCTERLRNVVAEQRRTGPARGFWPTTGDPRGAAWDLGFKLMSLQAYFRYARHGLLR